MRDIISYRDLKVTVFTNEYPPNIYGGAGVHVDYLTRALAGLMQVEVRCFGNQNVRRENLKIKGYEAWSLPASEGVPQAQKILSTLFTDLNLVREPVNGDIIHCHTWYSFFAGILAKLLYDCPLVTTVHSLEPLRPWKKEQLGSGYNVSSWLERLGLEASEMVIAVSQEMKRDILQYYSLPEERVEIIPNGIDPGEFREVETGDTRREFGIKRPYILFVGRLSRQKGIFHLMDAVPRLPQDIQVVLCTGKADTPELVEELTEKIKFHPNIVWINQMLSKPKLIELYSRARVFVCPSIYEPFGIINLEAMACGTPVVASATGGIKEVVVPEVNGLLVEPANPAALAEAVTRILVDDSLYNKLRKNGRKHVEEEFSWDRIAKKTAELYLKVLTKRY